MFTDLVKDIVQADLESQESAIRVALREETLKGEQITQLLEAMRQEICDKVLLNYVNAQRGSNTINSLTIYELFPAIKREFNLVQEVEAVLSTRSNLDDNHLYNIVQDNVYEVTVLVRSALLNRYPNTATEHITYCVPMASVSDILEATVQKLEDLEEIFQDAQEYDL